MRTFWIVLLLLCGLARAEQAVEKPPAPPEETATTDDDVKAAIRAAKQKREQKEAAKREAQEAAEKAEREAQAEADRKAEAKKHGVTIGMTKKQVLESKWGAPKDINRTVTKSGVHEQWVYGDHNYLYFDDDKLVSIQN